MSDDFQSTIREALPVRIGDVAKTAGGSTPSRSRNDYWAANRETGVPWVRTAEIVFEPIYKAAESVSKTALKECSLPIAPPGTVLIAMFGEGKTRGQSAVLQIQATFNQACFAIFPNDKFIPEYLQLWLRCKYQHLRKLAHGRGGSQANLNGSILNDLKVPWVNFSTQRQIVTGLQSQLEQANHAAIAANAQLRDVEILRELMVSSAFRALCHTRFRFFDGPSIAKTPKDSNEYLILGENCKKIGSGSTPSGGHKSYALNGFNFIRSQNVLMRSFSCDGMVRISPEVHSSMSETEVRNSDVLLNITGASIGRVCVVPKEICPANVNQHVCIIRCAEKIDPQFLMLFLSSREFQNKINDTQAGGTRQALTKSDIEQFRVPNISMIQQRQFVEKINSHLREIDAMAAATEKQVKELELLPQKLLASVFEH